MVRIHSLRLIIFLGIIYLILPTQNSTIDGIGYAASVKWNFDLFSGHHLLYNPVILFFTKIFPFDVLAVAKMVNAFIATMILLSLYFIISIYQKNETLKFWLIFFSGASFCIMRFATENEVYLFPVLFSLLGTYNYFKWLKNPNNINLFFLGFWLSFACLFHQIHFFWWLVTLFFVMKISTFNIKSIFIFSISALIVPLTYAFVLVIYFQKELSFENYFELIFETFHSGSSSLGISFLGIARFLISIVRSFFQIHHHVLIFLNNYPVMYILFVIFILGLIYFIVKWRPVLKFNSNVHFYLFSVIFFQLFFALLSLGNSEFMVMISVIFTMILSSLENIDLPKFKILVLIMFFWNLFFSLLPNYLFHFTSYKSISSKVEQNPDKIFIISDYGTTQNELMYKNGFLSKNLVNIDRNKNYKILIDKYLSNNTIIWTDYGPNLITYETGYFLNSVSKDFQNNYIFKKSDSIQTFRGKHYLYQIISRKNKI